jgi:ankyrin repeat protein
MFEATDSTGEDNSCVEDGEVITEVINCTKNIDYSEDADCAKDTNYIEGDSHQDLRTSLYRAVSEGDRRAAETLLNLAKQFGSPFGDSTLSSALKIASIRGHVAVVKLLLNSGVPTTNALREAAMAGRPEALPHLLDKAGCQPGALSFASRGRSEWLQQDICRLLLDHGADVDEMSSETGQPEWGPPLLEAAMYNKSGIFKLLLDRGASLDLALEAQRNNRSWAKNSGFSHALDGGTDEPVLDAAKALFFVLREGDSKLAAILNLCYGANNNDALVIAARYGDEAVAKRLLDGGADPFQPNSNGLSAIEAARRSHRTGFVKLLLRQDREPPDDMALLRESFAVRARFISQCRNISNVAGRLPAHLAVEAEKLSRYFLDHRPAFHSAMSSMRGLSVLEAPDNVCSLLAYLCLARAMTDLIRSKAGADFTGEFQDGVHSFFEVLRHGKFKQTNDALLYEQVVRLAWGVELSQESSSSGSVDENILRMKDLAAKLLFQSTQFTESAGSAKADHHPLLGERVAPGCTSPMAKQSIGFWSFDSHAPDLSRKTFPPSRTESLNQPCGIAESFKQDHRPPNIHFGERNAIDGGGIKTAIIRIATGTLFALMILLLNSTPPQFHPYRHSLTLHWQQ